MCGGAGRRSRFRRKVPEEGSGEFRCRFRSRVPEGSGRFRTVPAYAGVGSGGRFRKVPKGWFRKVLEGSGGFRRVPARVGVGSKGRVRKVPEGSEEFRRVLVWDRRQGFRRFRTIPVWFVALQPGQEQPCD